jgi:hypothetical protein
LDITELRNAASGAHIFPAMVNNSLLSVLQLYDEVHSVLFSINEVTIQDPRPKKPFERELGCKHWLMAHKYVQKSTSQKYESHAAQPDLSSQ